jgi:amino acid adenylation domain-containing protein
MVLAAGFAALLARLSGEDDVVVGAPVAGRKHAELEGLVGFFVNTLPLRVPVPETARFVELLRQVRATCLDAYRYQDVPFDQLVQELRPDRDAHGRSPIVRHLLVLHNTPPGTMRVPDLSAELLPVHTGTAKFDLEFELAPSPEGGLTGWLEFATGLFDGEVAEGLASGLRSLLEAAADDPERALWSLPVMTETARRRVVEEFSGASVPPVVEPLVPAWFESAVDAGPGRPAVVVDHTDETLTYEALDTRANRLAHHLRGRGVGADDRVGVYFERGAGLITAILGVLKAGAAFVPLEPEHPVERLRHVVAGAAPRLVLTDATHAERVASLGVEAVTLDLAAAEPDHRPGHVPAGSGAAYVLFTSGSTGRPKGAVNTHAAITNRLRWMQDEYGLGCRDRVLQKTPIGFDVSVWELLWPLVTGATLVFARPGGHRNPDYLHEVIDRREVTTCHFVPSMLRAFLDAPAGAHAGLRRVICSGEELPAGLAGRFLAAHPGTGLHNLYGPTEAAIDVSAHAVTAPVPARIPIGRPIRGVELHVLDKRLLPQPVGTPGELFIGGVQLARGYAGQPGLTAERFVPSPFAPGRRLYATGDRARWLPDGTLEFLGRLDGQVKVRGNRVEPAEIEAVLRDHPVVREPVLLARTGPDGGTELTAYATVDRAAIPADLGEDQVERWTSVFDDTYAPSAAGPTDDHDPSFDIRSWVSSYTGEPIGAEDMREWVDSIVGRVLDGPHETILEIGCGSGLLLFQLAPECASYHGTDVSDAGLKSVAENLGRLGEAADRVSLSRRPADDFTGIPDGGVDVVLLNSIVQYFPDADYLVRVLQGAARVVRPGGRVIIGDVRCRSAHPALRASIELSRAGDDVPLAALRRTVRQQVARDEELVVEASLFRHFGAWCDAVSDVMVLPKAGRRRNELTKFRYDVILHVGERSDGGPVTDETTWNGDEELLGLLRRDLPERLAVFGVPDARVWADVRAAELLDDPTLDQADVGALRAAVAGDASGAVEPADLLADVTRLGYTPTLLRSDVPGRLELLLTRDGTVPRLRTLPDPGTPDWRAFTNDPLDNARRAAVIGLLREHVRRRLPEYMVPAHFVLLDEWPIGPNGKLDRGALARQDVGRPALGRLYVAPRNPVERTVTTVWAELLEIDRVGVNDDFFQLGGHSLLATRVISRIRAVYDVDLRIVHLLEAPTPAGLAAVVDRLRGDSRAAGPIRRIDRSRFAVAAGDTGQPGQPGRP